MAFLGRRSKHPCCRIQDSWIGDSFGGGGKDSVGARKGGQSKRVNECERDGEMDKGYGRERKVREKKAREEEWGCTAPPTGHQLHIWHTVRIWVANSNNSDIGPTL